MTKEEAINAIKEHIDTYHIIVEIEALEMAIEALEREECEDCISRQSVLDIIEKEEFKGDALSEIEKLPSVNPKKRKTGHWITWKEADNDIPSETRFECSVCHDAAQTLCNGLDLLSPYCPNCGARMEGAE